ncbi:MAG: HAD hydrolase-like protein [bacterium]|nr:HAD hydrolase-like protein [bacterium]
MQVFTDLDGVIIDTSRRSFEVYKNILIRHKAKHLRKDTYLNLKRKKVSVGDILAQTKAQDLLKIFEGEWLREIETEKSLAFDQLMAGALTTLKEFKTRYPLYLTTLRKKPELLMKELTRLGIKKLFTGILVGSTGKIRYKDKVEKIKILAKPGDVMIGDSETDIRAGKKLGMITIAIESGWRSQTLLKKESPDYLVRSIANINSLPIFKS